MLKLQRLEFIGYEIRDDLRTCVMASDPNGKYIQYSDILKMKCNTCKKEYHGGNIRGCGYRPQGKSPKKWFCCEFEKREDK